jgi:COP9 signalosome complex subunit 2
VKSAVTRNHSEKSIDSILNIVEKSSDAPEAAEYVEQFYSLTLECLQAIKNERLWIKTNIKLARFELQRQNYLWLTRKLRELHRLCQKEDGSDDPNKSTALMEIYALEIQMYSETRNNQQLKLLYRRALRLRAAVPHPKIQGVIRECGGKMNLSEENWAEAQVDFFEAFRNYDEAGDGRRIQMLRYLLLTTLLTKSDINPFDSREAKPYMSDERVQTMASLVDAYQRDDMDQYEIILHKSGDLLNDPYIAENMDEVTRNMRTKAVLKLIAPYTRMRLQWLASHLHMTTDEVREILCFLVLDGRVKGRIDEGNGIFTVTSAPDAARRRAIKRLKDNVKHLGKNLLKDGEGFKPPPDPPDEPVSAPSWPKAVLERGNVKRKGRRLRGRMAGYRVIPRYRS